MEGDRRLPRKRRRRRPLRHCRLNKSFSALPLHSSHSLDGICWVFPAYRLFHWRTSPSGVSRPGRWRRPLSPGRRRTWSASPACSPYPDSGREVARCQTRASCSNYEKSFPRRPAEYPMYREGWTDCTWTMELSVEKSKSSFSWFWPPYPLICLYVWLCKTFSFR